MHNSIGTEANAIPVARIHGRLAHLPAKLCSQGRFESLGQPSGSYGRFLLHRRD